MAISYFVSNRCLIFFQKEKRKIASNISFKTQNHLSNKLTVNVFTLKVGIIIMYYVKSEMNEKLLQFSGTITS